MTPEISAYLRTAEPSVAGRRGHEQLVLVLYRLGDLGVSSPDEAVAILESSGWTGSCDPPWSRAELQAQARSCWRTRRNPIGEGGRGRTGKVERLRPASFPPRSEVFRLWERSTEPIADNAVALAWWSRRRFPTEPLAWVHETARALRLDSDAIRSLPEWARLGDWTWADTQHAIVMPLVDRYGAIVSLQVRCCRDSARIKETSPRGYGRRGLVVADLVGRALLESYAWPEDYPAESREAWVAEGAKDALALWAAAQVRRRFRPAVFGVTRGAWSVWHAGRLPPDTAVKICTDHDEAGDSLAAEVATTLQGRVREISRVHFQSSPAWRHR